MKTESFSKSKQTIFNGCLTALDEMNCDIESNNFSSGNILATMSGGLLSYGHKLTITVKTTDANKTKVSVTSCSVGIQVIDWGTNSNNEEDFIVALTNALK